MSVYMSARVYTKGGDRDRDPRSAIATAAIISRQSVVGSRSECCSTSGLRADRCNEAQRTVLVLRIVKIANIARVSYLRESTSLNIISTTLFAKGRGSMLDLQTRFPDRHIRRSRVRVRQASKSHRRSNRPRSTTASGN